MSPRSRAAPCRSNRRRQALPRLLSAIKKDCPCWNSTPQGLSRKGSVCAAVPAVSETRLVCWNPLLVGIGAGALAAVPQAKNAPIRQRVAQSVGILLFTGELPPRFCLLDFASQETVTAKV